MGSGVEKDDIEARILNGRRDYLRKGLPWPQNLYVGRKQAIEVTVNLRPSNHQWKERGNEMRLLFHGLWLYEVDTEDHFGFGYDMDHITMLSMDEENPESLWIAKMQR